MKNLTNEYFNWLCRLICDEQFTKKLSYTMLLEKMFETNFNYILPRDGNRYEDGIDLRYRFGYETGVADALIARELDGKPCSILEMMVALALRCKESIMNDPEIGDRTGYWFWKMVTNLGLGLMTDTRFSQVTVNYILDRFISREYAPDGEGGLFTVKNPREDMRGVEIWYQAMWYLSEITE